MNLLMIPRLALKALRQHLADGSDDDRHHLRFG
jgi:hypothetical protein